MKFIMLLTKMICINNNFIYRRKVCLNPINQASSCILLNNLIALRGPHLIVIKTGWQRSADEANINFMIINGVTFFHTKIQVVKHETTISGMLYNKVY